MSLSIPLLRRYRQKTVSHGAKTDIRDGKIKCHTTIGTLVSDAFQSINLLVLCQVCRGYLQHRTLSILVRRTLEWLTLAGGNKT